MLLRIRPELMVLSCRHIHHTTHTVNQEFHVVVEVEVVQERMALVTHSHLSNSMLGAWFFGSWFFGSLVLPLACMTQNNSNENKQEPTTKEPKNHDVAWWFTLPRC
jgi:hypothetical protein